MLNGRHIQNWRRSCVEVWGAPDDRGAGGRDAVERRTRRLLRVV